jgi:hypothetical protein
MVAVDPSGAVCTARKRALFYAMGLKTMRRSLAFPPVLTSYKLLEIERTQLLETCTGVLLPLSLGNIEDETSLPSTEETRRMDTTMKLSHHDPPPPLDLDDIRKRNAAARHLLQEWLADASGYDEETWPLLQARLEAERTAPARKLFRG